MNLEWLRTRSRSWAGRPIGPVSLTAGGNPPGATSRAREPFRQEGCHAGLPPRNVAGEFAHVPGAVDFVVLANFSRSASRFAHPNADGSSRLHRHARPGVRIQPTEGVFRCRFHLPGNAGVR